MNTKRILIIITLLSLLGSTVFAAVPRTISYQGYLKDAAGQPVNATVQVTFQLYDSNLAGKPIWTETLYVTPQNGMYSVLLGTYKPLDAVTVDVTGLYLGIQVGSDPEMIPRSQLVSVPYALRADTAENVNSASIALDGSQIVSGTIGAARLPADIITTGNLSSINAVGTVTTGSWNASAVPVANGGTGATTAGAAITNLLPAQGGQSGKLLGTNGTSAGWMTPPPDSRFSTGTNWAVEGRGRDCSYGEIILSAGSVANGLPANGQILQIASNTALFSLLGFTYGGNGQTTFALPDLRGAAPNGLTYSICTFGIYPARR